ncbi:MAG: DUF6600 domain-containing protein [Chitinophagaceae bacterium]
MKNSIKIFILLFVLNAGINIIPQKVSAQQVSVSMQLFYDQLSPYGQWVNHPRYGYTWVPSVQVGFAPYSTGGHWIFTNDGWTWVSDYDWGWAPFHYGRWYLDASYGWLWVPDTHWGPAWVTWRRASGYYGWTPLGPRETVSTGFRRAKTIPSDRWIFVKDNDFGRPDANRYYVNRSQNVTIIKNSTIINNVYVDKSRNVTYVRGPQRDEVQKVTGREIKPVVIKEVNKPEQKVTNGQLEIYKPVVQKTNNGIKPAPKKVVNLSDVKQNSNNASKSDNNQSNNNPPNNNSSDNNNKASNNNNAVNNNATNNNNNANPPSKKEQRKIDRQQRKTDKQNKRKQNQTDSTTSLPANAQPPKQ